MEAKAIGRYLRVTPRKARFVLDTVRGKSAKEALAMLKFIPNEAARYIENVLESAVANAENNFAMDREILRISSTYVDQGPTMKRIHPRAMGRAFRILKRSSHITVAVSEDETLRKVVVKPKKGRTSKAKAETSTAHRKAASPKSPAKPKAAKKPAAESAPAESPAEQKAE